MRRHNRIFLEKFYSFLKEYIEKKLSLNNCILTQYTPTNDLILKIENVIFLRK